MSDLPYSIPLIRLAESNRRIPHPRRPNYPWRYDALRPSLALGSDTTTRCMQGWPFPSRHQARTTFFTFFSESARGFGKPWDLKTTDQH